MALNEEVWLPYVVRAGDTLTSLAYAWGIDGATVWDSPDNAALKAIRKNPDILAPGDVIWRPPPDPPIWLSVMVGATNTFVVSIPPNSPYRSAPRAYASSPYHATGDGVDVQGTADGDGCLTLEVPVTTTSVRIEFQQPAGVIVAMVGHLDPCNTGHGARQRLRSLGFPSDNNDPDDHALTRALALFQIDQGLPPTGKLDAATQDALEKAHGL